MGNITGKISFRITAVFFCIILLAAAVTGVLSYRSGARRIRKEFISNGEFILRTYSPLISKASGLADDLLLISYMQGIMEQEDAEYAMVLERNGRIIAHHRAEERGRIYDDDETMQVLESSGWGWFFRKRDGSGSGIYDMYMHVRSARSSTVILRVGLSSDNLLSRTGGYAENIMVAVLLATVLGTAGIFIMTSLMLSPLPKVRKALEALSAGDYAVRNMSRGTGELDELLNTAAVAARRVGEAGAEAEARTEKYRRMTGLYIRSVGGLLGDNAVLTDTENRIIHCGRTAASVISAEEVDMEGRHILEVARNLEFINVLKESAKEPNSVKRVSLKDNNRTVEILTVKDTAGDLVGTIARITA